jgi:RNA polymerase sigma factor (sigma-70 family)
MFKLHVNSHEKEDITQECYVALLEKQSHLEKGIELGDDLNYAATICRSKILDIFREQKTDIKTYSLFSHGNYNKASQISELMTDSITEEQLQDAILDLPDRTREAVWEQFIKGNPRKTVAVTLGVSESTVQRECQKGIKMLKKKFEVE